jgi:hypothetical protein
MRTASILLTLVVVLGFVNEAGVNGGEAQYEGGFLPPATMPPPTLMHDYTVRVAGQLFGFKQWQMNNRPSSYFYVGPFGEGNFPFTATQGLVGFCLIVLTLIALLGTFTVRWKRRGGDLARMISVFAALVCGDTPS